MGQPLTLHPALHGHPSNGNGKLDQERTGPVPRSKLDQERTGPVPRSKLDQERTGPVPRSNGVMEKVVGVAQKDSSCQTPSEQETSEGSGVKASQSGSFSDSTMEHFSRSFKEATVSLVRTTEDLRGDKVSQGGKGSRSAQDRPWAKPAPGGPQGGKGSRSAQDRPWAKPVPGGPQGLGGTRSAKDRPWAKPVPGVPQGLGGTRSPPYKETDGYCPDLELSDSEPEAKGQRLRQGRVKQSLGGSSRTSVQR
nr:protein Jade-3-like [Oncorhynchus nerka]